LISSIALIAFAKPVEFPYNSVYCDVLEASKHYDSLAEVSNEIILLIKKLKQQEILQNQIDCIESFVKLFLEESCSDYNKIELEKYLGQDEIETKRESNVKLPNIVQIFFSKDWSFMRAESLELKELFKLLKEFHKKLDLIVNDFYENYMDSESEYAFKIHLLLINSHMKRFYTTVMQKSSKPVLAEICFFLKKN
ncbi:hypothetical protein HZS_5379, partial [Henneguya salminicola]